MHRDVTNLPLPVKARLGSGESFWQTKAAAGLPAATLTDGPHGVRLQQNLTDRQGFAESVPATCFPTAAALAQTWDPVLVERVAGAIGEALSHPVVGPRLLAVFAQYLPSGAGEGSAAGDLLRMIESIPLDRLAQFGVELGPDALGALLGPDG